MRATAIDKGLRRNERMMRAVPRAKEAAREVLRRLSERCRPNPDTGWRDIARGDELSHLVAFR